MQHDLAVGDVIDGKYRIDALLGAGGMGAVYRATHLGTTRTVAVKVIQPRLSNRGEFVSRFRREAAAAGRLRHPNVVDVTDFGIARTGSREIAYLVMEFLDGCTLGDVLRAERTLPLPWVVDIVEQVCSALDEAHTRGIVHRDLKPENIWLEPNRRGGHTVKVLDFGLVKLAMADEERPPVAAPFVDADATPTIAALPTAGDEETRLSDAAALEAIEDALTTIAPATPAPAPAPSHVPTDALTYAGAIMGTPQYMSPEQWAGDRVDRRADIYSLGVIAYRMLAGVRPFEGAGHDLMRRHLHDAPASIRSHTRRVPRGVDRVILSALAKNPADRPETAGGFASALRARAEGSGTLLRQALALYSERFPVLIQTSLLGHIPLILVVAFLVVADRTSFVPQSAAPLLILSIIVVPIACYFVVSAAVTPLVAQSIVSPLRPLTLAIAWGAMRRQWWRFTVTSATVATATLAGLVLGVIPGVMIALVHALYAPVVMLEDSRTLATLGRARRLAMRSWSTVLIITALQLALPLVVWILSVNVNVDLALDERWQPKTFGFSIQTGGDAVPYQLLSIFVTPLTAAMSALLYVKARQAGGESLREGVERLGGEIASYAAARRAAASRVRADEAKGTAVATPT